MKYFAVSKLKNNISQIKNEGVMICSLIPNGLYKFSVPIVKKTIIYPLSIILSKSVQIASIFSYHRISKAI